MEGLEISEVGLRETLNNNRIDAECYQKAHILISKEIIAYPHKTLSNIAEITDGEHGSPKLDEDSGIVYLSGHNVKNNFIDYSDIRYCDRSIHEKNARSALRVNNVLLSIVGTVGNASVIYEDVEGNTDRNVATIKNIHGVNPYFLSTFLNSKYGKYQTGKLSTGNVQPLLNLIQVKSVIICLPSDSFQKEIEQIVQTSHNKAKQASVLYTDAKNVLLEELKLNKWQPEKKTYNIKQLKESFLVSGRLDAEHYQVKYDELELLIKATPYKSIAEIQQFNARGVQPDYVESGEVSVVNSKHILEDGIDYDNFEHTTTDFLNTHSRAQIRYGDILIYTTGANIGRTQVYLKDEPAIASNHVNILRVQGVNPIFLAMVLNSQIGRLQTEKLCTGSAQAELYPSDIEKFIVPILPEEKQQAIADYVQKSVSLRQQARQLLEDAQLMVEKEIQ